MGELSLFNLIPLPKSKSQILTGDIWEEKQNVFRRLKKKHFLTILADLWPLCLGINISAVNSPCLHSHRECFQVSGLYVPFLKRIKESIFVSYPLILKAMQLYRYPFEIMNSNTDCHFVQVVLPLLWRKSRALAMSCTTRQASCSLKCCLLWMCSKIDPKN